MSSDITSWAWHSDTPLPGHDAGSQSRAFGALSGTAVDPASITAITWQDASRDGILSDADPDDAGHPGARVTIAGTTHTVTDIASFPGATLVVNGQPVTVTMAVWLLEGGTWLARIPDSQIPPGVHPPAVTALHLGTWDGVEYSATHSGTRAAAFICFAAGTLIHTRYGLTQVQDLTPGDLVLTADHGFRPVRWIGRRTLPGTGRAAPVTIAAGALGNSRDLVVSQQHRMLVSGWRAELYAGLPEVLVPAVHMVDDRAIRITPRPFITYVHFLMDSHEIVFAEGIAAESFHPGAVGLSDIGAVMLAELLAIFPELGPDGRGYGATARPVATGTQARALRPA